MNRSNGSHPSWRSMAARMSRVKVADTLVDGVDGTPPLETMSTHPVVLVTGAAQRIGRAIALELAHHGYDVAVHCHRSVAAAHETAAAAQRAGVRARVFQADLSDENQCRGLAADVQRHFERLDAVVNNASLFEYDVPANFTVAAMERHWRANTAPAILLSQALHGQALASGRVGVVVNLLDQKLWNPNPDYFSYTLSKAALQTAT